MIINSSTELMKNQKHAVVMAPDKQFEVLQTQEGNALFFSIGTDGVFYLTREIPADTHGWSKIDLSSVLSAQNNNAKITVKLFDVAQDLVGATTDIAVVITINGVDSLYVSTGNANTDDDWANVANGGITWTAIGFDGGNDNAATLNVADINFCQSGQVEFLQADIIQGGSNTGDYINRYFVDYNNTQSNNFWNPIDLPYTISAGDIQNEVGFLYVAAAPGTYTLSGLKTLSSTEMELMFWPFWGIEQGVDPMHISFTLPDNTTAIAVSQAIGSGDNEGADDTDLFVAAGNSLYFVPHQKQPQGDVASGLICTHPNLSGVEKLHVNNTSSKTVVWGLNESGDVFYMSCIAGSEATGSAWSIPSVILSGIDDVASFINGQQNNNIIFAQTAGDASELMQLTQDANTNQWNSRQINLPSTDYHDYVETFTFTTQVHVTDDNTVPISNQQLTISSSAACSVYINNQYHVLYPNIQLQVTSDESGYIAIQQSIDTLAGAFFYITDGTTTANVNPMDNVLANLKSQSGTNGPNLDVSVKDEWGTPTDLVKDKTVSDTDKASVAQYIANFIKLQDSLPSNGQQASETDPPQATENITGAVAAPHSVFGITHQHGRIKYFGSIEEAQKLGLVLHGNRLVSSAAVLVGDGNGLEILAGDGWRWLKSKIGEIETYYTDIINGLTHLFFEIAGQLYHFAIRCIHDIAAGIHFVLNKIAVAFEDMVRWLGSIFSWTDILRTHNVLRSMCANYINHCISNIDVAKSAINGAVDEAVATIDQWAGLNDNGDLPTDSYSDQSSSNNSDSGQHSAQSHWGHQHTKNNCTNSGLTTPDTEIAELLNDFFTAIEVEADIITAAVNQITDVISQAGSMSAGDLIKKIVAIIADAVIESVANVTDAFLTAAETIVADIVTTVFMNPIQIPVLSPLYKFFTKGNELSFLDLICLVVAVPVNVMFKLTEKGAAPFQDDAAYSQLISAKTFDDFIQAAGMVTPPSSVSAVHASTGLLGKTVPDWDDATNDFWTRMGNMSALMGSILVSGFGALKSVANEGFAGYVFAALYGASYIPYVGPDIIGVIQNFYQPKKNWYNIMNAGLAVCGLVKSCVDIKLIKPASNPSNPPASNGTDPVVNPPDNEPVQNPNPAPDMPDDNGGTEGWKKPFINDNGEKAWSWNDASPFFEAGINLLWEVPVVAAYLDADKSTSSKKTSAILQCTGNTLFNFGGIISFGGTFGPPPVQVATLVAQAVCNLGYGLMIYYSAGPATI